MKKINKTIITLACSVLPLSMVIPTVTSCNKNQPTGDVTFSADEVLTYKNGFVLDVKDTSSVFSLTGFKYTGPAGCSISATISDCTWAGTYDAPVIVNRTNNTFDVNITFKHPESLYGRSATFNLNIDINGNKFVVKNCYVYFELAQIVISESLKNNVIATKQSSSWRDVAMFAFKFPSQIAYGFETFYVEPKIKSENVQSKITFETIGESEDGRFRIKCHADNIPDDGENFEVEYKVGNRTLDEAGIVWGKTYTQTIKISRADADLFNFNTWDNYVTIQGFNTHDETITIPEQINDKPVKTVGANSGSSNKYIKKVVLPKTMTKFGSIITNLLENLESISINGVEKGVNNNNYYYTDDCLIYHKDGESSYTLVCATTKTNVVPEEVTKIDSGAMGLRNIENFTIGKNVTEIGRLTDRKQNIKSIKVDPDNQTFSSRIEGEEYNCIFSKSVDDKFDTIFWACDASKPIPNGTAITIIGTSAYENCKTLKNYTFPNTIEIISPRAFHGCSSLESIIVPETVALIPADAFRWCQSLTSVKIPKSTLLIGHQAFDGCWALQNFEFYGDDSSWASSCTVAARAFNECMSLKSFTVPANMNFARINPFTYCYSLTELKVDQGNEEYQSKFNEKESNCIVHKTNKSVLAATTGATIPEDPNVTTISEEAFTGVLDTVITIPANITEISGRAFYDADYLTQLIVKGGGTWTAYDRPTAETGTDVTQYMADPDAALYAIKLCGYSGHVSRTNP